MYLFSDNIFPSDYCLNRIKILPPTDQPCSLLPRNCENPKQFRTNVLFRSTHYPWLLVTIIWAAMLFFSSFLGPEFQLAVRCILCSIFYRPVHLHLIFKISSLKNQVQQAGFFVYFELDFYCLCSLQISSSKETKNPVCRTRFFVYFELDFCRLHRQ